MKKSVLVALLAITLSITACSTKEVKQAIESQQTEDKDFRNVNWGDNIEVVKKSEKSKPSKEESNSLSYNISVSGYSNVLLIYNFNNENKLESAAYGFDGNSHGSEDIERFNVLKTALNDLYGKAFYDVIDKDEKLSILRKSYWTNGMALEKGYDSYLTSWDTDTTRIILSMATKNGVTTTAIYYEDITQIDKPIDRKDGL